MSDLKAYFDDKKQAMIDLLTELIALESPTHNKQAVDKLGNRLAELFEAGGASVERHPRQAVGDIILARWNHNSENKPILILSHMDTVWSVGSVAKHPTRLADDGRMYGMGAADMKGGIVVALTAIQALIERDEMPSRPIWYLATSDEEIGSNHSKSLIEEVASQAALALVTEPPTSDGALKTWRKGVASYQLDITGKAAHAGNEPEMGINAIIEFAQQAIELNSMNDLKNGTSVSVTQVEGGTATNVIPEQVSAMIDVRAMSHRVYQSLHEKIMERLPFIPGAQISIERNHYRPPMERNGEAFAKVQAIGKTLGLTIREDGAGGGSDGNYTAAIGVPTIDGLGAEGDGLHAPHEHILINSLPKKAALMAAILRDWD